VESVKIVIKDTKLIKKLLLINGFSQRSLAKQIDVTSGYISQIINGERNPSGKIAKNICNALNVPFEEIFFIDNAYKSNLA
jgi:transcriptional regulator with XRE-family HTH domain